MKPQYKIPHYGKSLLQLDALAYKLAYLSNSKIKFTRPGSNIVTMGLFYTSESVLYPNGAVSLI